MAGRAGPAPRPGPAGRGRGRGPGPGRGGGRPAAPPPSPAERLAGFARDKALLLVLDNCEHLVGACAAGPGAAPAGPAVRVLATSREVLGVPGEVVWPVPPWPSPPPAMPPPWPAPTPVGRARGAGRLRRGAAVRRAGGRRRPGLHPGRGQRPGGGRAVPSPGRPPLAIELAAARVRALPVAEIADRLATGSGCWPGAAAPSTRGSRPCGPPSTGAGSCWRSPTGGCGGGCRCSRVAGRWRPPRRSAAATASTPGTCWRGCSGWWTGRWWWRPAATGAVPDAGDDAGLRGRAAGRGRRAETVAARHTAWCLDLAERAAAHRTARRWLRLLDADYDNLRAALDRAVAAATPAPRCGWPPTSAGTGGPGTPWRAISGWPRSSPWPTGGRRPRSWPGRCRRAPCSRWR